MCLETFLDIIKGMVMSKDVQLDFLGHVKNIEDVDIVSPSSATSITDHQLKQSGLIKTTAYVRSSQSKNAIRVKKHKTKQLEKGIIQLNIEIPEHHKESVKLLAKQLCDGKDFKQALLNQDMNLLQKTLLKFFL